VHACFYHELVGNYQDKNKTKQPMIFVQTFEMKGQTFNVVIVR